MKTLSRLVIGVVMIVGLVFSFGCASYRPNEKDSGVLDVGGFIWPAPQSQILVVNKTGYPIDIKEGPNTEKRGLKPAETFAFNYNVFTPRGMDIPLTAIIYDQKGTNTRSVLGVVTKTFHLHNSQGRYDAQTWVIQNVGNRDAFEGYIGW